MIRSFKEGILKCTKALFPKPKLIMRRGSLYIFRLLDYMRETVLSSTAYFRYYITEELGCIRTSYEVDIAPYFSTRAAGSQTQRFAI